MSAKKGQKGLANSIPVEKIQEAIKGSAGIMSTIARKLGISWHSTRNLIENNELLKECLSAEMEVVIDMAEAKCYELIKNGDANMIKFILTTKGRKRGFSEKINLEHSGGISINIGKEFDKL